MQLGVMSDSHDNLPATRAAVGLFRRLAVDRVVHLLLNPGEVGGWVTGRATAAVVEL